jgi:hypothetical protein
MSNAFISWLSLFTDRDPFGTTGKLAAVWFDKLIIETPQDDGIRKVVEGAIERGKIPAEIHDQLLNHWRPIQLFLPDFSYEPVFCDGAYRQLWETVVDTVYEATKAEFPGHTEDRAFMHEVAMAANGLMRAHISWCSLNALDGTTFITNNREARVAESLFVRTDNREFDIFRHFADLRIPDLTELPWQRIWDLRHHPKLEAFRRRLSAVSGADTEITSPAVARELEAEFVANLEEFAQLCRPAPLRSLVKSVISNVPLPIRINPASVAFGGKEVREALDRDKRYGWMFFGIDLRSACQ